MDCLLPLVFVAVAGCGGPDDGAVRAAFLRGEPGAQVLSLAPVEGDDGHVYYRIRYRTPPDSAVREAEWGYRKGPDGGWMRFSPAAR